MGVSKHESKHIVAVGKEISLALKLESREAIALITIDMKISLTLQP